MTDEVVGSALQSQSDEPDDVIFKVCESVRPAVAAALPRTPDEVDQVEETMAEVIVHERQLVRRERAAELGPLREQIAELRGKLDAIISLIGNSTKAADLVVLSQKKPNNAVA